MPEPAGAWGLFASLRRSKRVPALQKNLIGELLLHAGAVTQVQLDQGLARQKTTGKRLGQTLMELGFVTEAEMLSALESQLGMEYIHLEDEEIQPSAVSKLPANFAQRHSLIPIREDNGTLVLAVSDPLNIQAVDEARLLLGRDVSVVIASQREIDKAINQHYGVGAETVEQMVRDSGEALDLSALEAEEGVDLESMAADASIVRFVNQVILEGFHRRGTDIHIEPFEDVLRIRYRVDGVLQEASTPATLKHFQAAIVSRVKIMADMNIAEKRRPQDGRVKVRIQDEDIDLRVSIIPTLHGESVNIRILSTKSLTLEELGLEPRDFKTISELVQRPHGIVLLTGPTGCGKTTTLYSALSRINSAELKIITVENPIEYQLAGVSQIQVNPRIDVTFANGLRSILRHDPDVIMIGEIRDMETAEIAIRAALTGHLVFSTLHTNDAASGVTRLLDMGVQPFLVSSSVEALIAQRLVRRICPHCVAEYEPDAEYLDEIGFPRPEGGVVRLPRGSGCDECRGTGFMGREAIYEILLVAEPIRQLVLEHASASQIKRKALELGMLTLRDAGWEKVLQGKTTIEEVLRVAEEDEFLE